jgi:hypothetical protein
VRCADRTPQRGVPTTDIALNDLPARHHADELDPIAFRQFAIAPFALMKRCLIMLDQDAVRLQAIMLR